MYRTICTQLWTDNKVQRLSVHGKLLFVYLITNPHTHLSGIYYLPQELIRKETGLSHTLCHTLFDTLSSEAMQMAYYDAESCTVLVRKMFGYQGQGPKNEQSAAKHLRTLHNSSLISLFLEEYPKVQALCQELTSIPYRYPIQSCPSVPVPVLLTSSLQSSSSDSEIKRKNDATEFEQFWLAYPKKVGKKDALRAWKKASDKPPLNDLLGRLIGAKQSEQWMKDNGQFIPNPSTWITQGRWDDQPVPRANNSMNAFLSRGKGGHE